MVLRQSEITLQASILVANNMESRQPGPMRDAQMGLLQSLSNTISYYYLMTRDRRGAEKLTEQLGQGLMAMTHIALENADKKGYTSDFKDFSQEVKIITTVG